jgi:hypothetical protein
MRMYWYVLALALMALTPSVRANIVPGRDYTVLAQPQRGDIQGKIEVIELFS